MSAVQKRLVSYILREHFGDIVETVGTYLTLKGARPLKDIVHGTKLKKEQVQKVLCSLVQHKLVGFEWNKKHIIVYYLELENVLVYVRFPRFLNTIKSLFGNTAQLIVEQIMQNGAMSMSFIVQNVVEHCSEHSVDKMCTESDVKAVFSKLVHEHYLRRVFSLDQDCSKEERINEEEMCFVLPPEVITSGKRKNNKMETVHPTKRQKTQEGNISMHGASEEVPDKEIIWWLNYNRFSQHFVEEIIISAVEKKFDSVGAEIIRTMLKTDELSRNLQTPMTDIITLFEIAKKLPKTCKIANSRISQYLAMILDDQDKFIKKHGDSGGGTFVVDLKKCVTTLCQHTIQSILQERYGSDSLRIFRLLIEKDHLEQKQIGEIAMIPSKDAKELLYKLFSEKILNMQEVPRTTDYAPSRTFYLFSVNLKQLSRKFLERCYQTLGNLMSRRQSETQEHKRLLEKQERMDATIAALKIQHGEEAAAEAVSELEELVTEADKDQLKKLKVTLNKLHQSELQVDETVFILNQYITNF